MRFVEHPRDRLAFHHTEGVRGGMEFVSVSLPSGMIFPSIARAALDRFMALNPALRNIVPWLSDGNQSS